MFTGSLVALVTPFMENAQAIDFASLDKLIEWHIANGTQGLVIAGTTGEASLLTEKEKITLVKHVIKVVKKRISVIVGTGHNATPATIEATQKAMKLGADGCLLMTPAYIKPTQEGLYEHFKAVANAVPIPQILYNVPGRTACDLLPDTVIKLSALPNIVGIKEATGNIDRANHLQAQCGDALTLLSGDDISVASFMLDAGGKGVISVTANVAPKMMQALYTQAQKKKREETLAIDKKLASLHQALFLETNPIPVKWALYYMGMISADIRLPLTLLSETHQNRLKSILDSLELSND